MDIHSHIEAPSIDPAVLRRMKRLDPSLVLTWHKYQIDIETGRNVIPRYGIIDPTNGDVTPGGVPIKSPMWYLWRRSDTCSRLFFVNVFPTFGDRQVLGLERDLARFMDRKRLMKFMADNIEANRTRDLDNVNYNRRGRMDANKSVNHDILFNGKRPFRDGKIFSSAGSKRRGGTGRVRIDRLDFIGRADETREE